MLDDKATVLVVDDTPANIELLHGILGNEYRIKVATGGAKALELALKAPRPDIILLDVMMPEMDGYEVCRRLKEDPETAPIPVVFITAKSQVEHEKKGLALGSVDYIAKPFDPEIVKARVHAHLANFEETRKLIRQNRELRARVAPQFADFTEQSLNLLIQSGENESVEFKSTLRWNLHADRSDKKVENACLKTVAGYLNANGGVLLVGVDDQGEVVGLGRDHFNSEDKMMLHWVNLINAYLGAEFVRNIRSVVCTIGDQQLLVVECLPAPAPVFLNRDNEESFFVRISNSTQALKPSAILAYIDQRFPSQG